MHVQRRTPLPTRLSRILFPVALFLQIRLASSDPLRFSYEPVHWAAPKPFVSEIHAAEPVNFTVEHDRKPIYSNVTTCFNFEGRRSYNGSECVVSGLSIIHRFRAAGLHRVVAMLRNASQSPSETDWLGLNNTASVYVSVSKSRGRHQC
jgi:hypothetical protein